MNNVEEIMKKVNEIKDIRELMSFVKYEEDFLEKVPEAMKPLRERKEELLKQLQRMF